MTERVRGTVYDDAAYMEAEAAAAITPGMGLEYAGETAVGNRTVQPVSSVEPTGPAARFAIEQRMPPRGASGATRPIEQGYDAGDNVEMQVFRSGDTVENALLAAGGDLTTAAHATIAIGDKLAFNDDGSLKLATTAGAEVVEAVEAVDNSGAAAGERARIAVEVL
ncbi:hypothetical protein [Halomarina litorea]|uniref:hypothetical protein n=1 Tax=Halomarina litorea TaxID=2961595 RepID=UPI0020C3B892|nr:hypothetical protein [Halomarina sp. BCD28]